MQELHGRRRVARQERQGRRQEQAQVRPDPRHQPRQALPDPRQADRQVPPVRRDPPRQEQAEDRHPAQLDRRAPREELPGRRPQVQPADPVPLRVQEARPAGRLLQASVRRAVRAGLSQKAGRLTEGPRVLRVQAGPPARADPIRTGREKPGPSARETVRTGRLVQEMFPVRHGSGQTTGWQEAARAGRALEPTAGEPAGRICVRTAVPVQAPVRAAQGRASKGEVPMRPLHRNSAKAERTAVGNGNARIKTIKRISKRPISPASAGREQAVSRARRAHVR